MIMEEERFSRIFSINDLDAKWELLIEVYNKMINKSVSSKLITVQEETKKLDDQLTTAIESKDISNWRMYRSMRNILYNTINVLKIAFYMNMLRKTRKMWRMVKQMNSNKKSYTPTLFNVNNKLDSS